MEHCGWVTRRALSLGPEDMPECSLPLSGSLSIQMMSSNSNLQAWQELTETGINWRVHQGECHRLAVEFQRSVEADPLLWVLVFQLLNILSCCIPPPTHISCIVLRWVRDCVSRFRFFSSFSETVTLSSTRDFAKFPSVAQSARRVFRHPSTGVYQFVAQEHSVL